MKTSRHLILLPAAILTAVSCTTIKPETDTKVNMKQGVPGGEVVQTSKITATVTGIDAAKRKVTLVTKDGSKMTVKAGPEIVNFDQIRIGDQLKATLTEDIVVRMAKPGEKTDDTGSAMIDLAPVGAKPGATMVETYQFTATVSAIDLKKRKAKLLFQDGSSKTVKVREDVDLTKHKVGEKVVIRSTETLAIQMEKP